MSRATRDKPLGPPPENRASGTSFLLPDILWAIAVNIVKFIARLIKALIA